MESSVSQIIQSDSGIYYNYFTIRITQSRIDRDLIALPRSLTNWFPDHNTTIKVFWDDSPILQTKRYTSYTSTTHESRIAGMAEWFRKNDIKHGDEIVIQLIDREHYIYRLISERYFLVKTKELQERFDHSESEPEASEKIQGLSQWTNSEQRSVLISEYSRLVETAQTKKREYVNKTSGRAKEGVPNNFRVLLRDIYQGHCQLCNFTFLKRDNTPYFEIHHINPPIGNHPQNLILVCANCHRQFDFATVQDEFNDDGWLRKVFFNDREYSVDQILLTEEFGKFKKNTYI